MQEHVIAKKYAKALASVCNTENITQVYNIYSELSKLFIISKFKNIIASPIISNTSKLAFLRSIVDTTTNSHAEKLLDMLVRNGRIYLIPFVALELKRIIDSRINVYEAVLYTQQELQADSLLNIQNKLGRKLGTTLKIVQSIDPTLDGIKLEIVELGIEVAFSRHKFIQELQDFILKAI